MHGDLDHAETQLCSSLPYKPYHVYRWSDLWRVRAYESVAYAIWQTVCLCSEQQHISWLICPVNSVVPCCKLREGHKALWRWPLIVLLQKCRPVLVHLDTNVRPVVQTSALQPENIPCDSLHNSTEHAGTGNGAFTFLSLAQIQLVPPETAQFETLRMCVPHSPHSEESEAQPAQLKCRHDEAVAERH